MPAKKGSTLKNSDRNYIFDKLFYESLKKDGITLSRQECSDAIRTSTSIIASIIKNDLEGFKLPNGLGYIAASKFKPKTPSIDWKETKKAGKRIHHLNLHTLGYSVGVFWYRVGRITNNSLNEVYKFKAWTTLSRAISKAFREGKNYKDWTIADFIEQSRLEHLYNKRYRKELKN